MQKILFTIIVVVALFPIILSAQNQNIFVLEKPALKNYKYYQNNGITLEARGMKVSGIISFISDSSLIIEGYGEVFLQDITRVYTPRWGFSFLQRLFITAGISYGLVSTANGALKNGQGWPGGRELTISGGLVFTGFALTPLTTRRHTIEELGRWKVKILDMAD